MDGKVLRYFLVATSSLFVFLSGASGQERQKKKKQPNILWITCEDIGPHLGCYGDTYSTTPNLDKFAKRALLYRNAWSNAPVCAPARTTIISGMYPPSTGSEHMRCQTNLPPDMHMFVVLLRRLGYYCTNKSKEDYNLKKPAQLWNASSRKAHYKNRKPGQPFFAVINLTVSHESRIQRGGGKLVHDPKKARVPAYHPDTSQVRRDWARYYDQITKLDEQVGQILRELQEAGLADDTIIFFYGDHGSGMPRNKRFAYNSGLHVPMLVHIPRRFRDLSPEGYAPGGQTNRLVSFVDLAPTVLSLAGTAPPKYYQGHAFMGKHEAKPRQYLHGFRGRMDERYDMVRSVRDERYVYIRNYMPHRPDGQFLRTMYRTPTTQVWKKLFVAGKLNAAQSAFFQPSPPEELYDLKNDRDEVKNLAKSPKHQAILKRLRKAQQDLVFQIRDVGFLPENEIHTRSKGSTPYQMGHDKKKYPLKRIFEMAEIASGLKATDIPKLQRGLQDTDSAVRYWAALGFLMRGRKAVQGNRELLRKSLKDPAPSVRIAAGEALGTYGSKEDVTASLEALIALGGPKEHDPRVRLIAVNAIDMLGQKAAPYLATIRTWPRKGKGPRGTTYDSRVLGRIVTQLSK